MDKAYRKLWCPILLEPTSNIALTVGESTGNPKWRLQSSQRQGWVIHQPTPSDLGGKTADELLAFWVSMASEGDLRRWPSEGYHRGRAQKKRRRLWEKSSTWEGGEDIAKSCTLPY